jgi:hypothetical protein
MRNDVIKEINSENLYLKAGISLVDLSPFESVVSCANDFITGEAVKLIFSGYPVKEIIFFLKHKDMDFRIFIKECNKKHY